MDLDDIEIIDIKYLKSGEEDFVMPLTPEREMWWHFWALWLHDALYCKWGMRSPSQKKANDFTDYYKTLFSKESRSDVLELLEYFVEDSVSTYKKWKNYVDTRPQPCEVPFSRANAVLHNDESSCPEKPRLRYEPLGENKQRCLERFTRVRNIVRR